MRQIAKKLTGLVITLCPALSVFAQGYAPQSQSAGRNYYDPAAAEAASSGGVDVLLVVVISLVFLIVIGMFVGFMIMLSQKNKQRQAEEERRLAEADASQRQMQELISLTKNKDAQLNALEEQLKNISVIDDAKADQTEMLLSRGLSSINLIFVDGERQGMMEVLDVHDPKDNPKKCRIGRNSGMCQVQIPDSDHSVSGNHCMVSFEGDAPHEQFFIRDTEASNATQVKKLSGKILSASEKVVLEDRDVITVGRTSLSVVIIRPLESSETNS